tara:strand:+ start:1771 stop:2247 length:477 start_codon:yes stop_codon:yes gene_type:complete
MYIPHSVGLVISVSQKCASTSISNAFHIEGLKPISAEAVAELKKSFWKVVGVVRDPIDRLESAYNFFKYGQCGTFPDNQQFDNIEAFTDAVLAGLLDDHWSPQNIVLGECDSYADLESLPIGQRLNACEHREKATYKHKELEQYYSKDFMIRGDKWEL